MIWYLTERDDVLPRGFKTIRLMNEKKPNQEFSVENISFISCTE